MTATDKRVPVPIASQILTIVGIILVLTFFLDILVSLGSPQLDNSEWQLKFMDELLNRGVTPLIGLALICTGSWFKRISTKPSVGRSHNNPWQDSKFWTFIIASLLGLLFVVMVPFHYLKTGELISQLVTQVNQQADQRKEFIKQERQQLQQSQKGWEEIQKEPQKLDQRIQDPRTPPQEKAALQQLKQDASTRDEKIQGQLTQIKQRSEQLTQQENSLKEQKQEAIDRANGDGLIKRIRAALRSVLLAIGFVTIGWMGGRSR